MTCGAETAGAAEVPLAEVLARTADEVRRCRDIVLRIETAAHGLLDGADLRADLRADLQAIDLLDQRLGDLATWLAALSRAAGDARLPGPVGALLHALRLADLRAALAGTAASASATPASELTELF